MTNTVQVRSNSAGARIVVTVQLALLAVYLIGSLGLLLSAIYRTGDYAAFFDPSVERLGDPKDALTPIGPESLRNPLLWSLGLSRVVAMFVQPLALALTALGTAFLAASWRAGDRHATHVVAVGTAAWLAVGALALTPYGVGLLGWLLD